MGTTAASGWALFWFLLGFTIIGTAAAGAGALGLLAGVGVLVYSGVLFKAAQAKEE